jgi:hypothetical protein
MPFDNCWWSYKDLDERYRDPSIIFTSLFDIVSFAFWRLTKWDMDDLFLRGFEALEKKLEEECEHYITPQALYLAITAFSYQLPDLREKEHVILFGRTNENDDEALYLMHSMIWIADAFRKKGKLDVFYRRLFASVEHCDPYGSEMHLYCVEQFMIKLWKIPDAARRIGLHTVIRDPAHRDLVFFAKKMSVVSAIDVNEELGFLSNAERQQVEYLRELIVQKYLPLALETDRLWQEIITKPQCDILPDGEDRFKVVGVLGKIFGEEEYFLRPDGIPFPQAERIMVRSWVNNPWLVGSWIGPVTADEMLRRSDDDRAAFALAILSSFIALKAYHSIVTGTASDTSAEEDENIAESEEDNPESERKILNAKDRPLTVKVRPHFMTLLPGRSVTPQKVEESMACFNMPPPEGKTFVKFHLRPFPKRGVRGGKLTTMRVFRATFNPLSILESL